MAAMDDLLAARVTHARFDFFPFGGDLLERVTGATCPFRVRGGEYNRGGDCVVEGESSTVDGLTTPSAVTPEASAIAGERRADMLLVEESELEKDSFKSCPRRRITTSTAFARAASSPAMGGDGDRTMANSFRGMVVLEQVEGGADIVSVLMMDIM